MKCKHTYQGTDLFLQFYADSTSCISMATTRPLGWRCVRCGEYASLGPASPPPPEELEAATILADVYANDEHVTDLQIAIGMAAYDADNDPPTGGLAWMWHAGWLARHVWKEQERG